MKMSPVWLTLVALAAALPNRRKSTLPNDAFPIQPVEEVVDPLVNSGVEIPWNQNTNTPFQRQWEVIMEVENFTVTPKGSMNATRWGGDHYYGAGFSNTFASRKALLHATNQTIGKATGTASIPKAGTWYVCVRYEAAYRFSTEFTLTVTQGGQKLKKLYGLQKSPKIWAFGWSLLNHEIGGCGADPTPECHWTWGATENWVWEFYPATLSAGSATFEIDITNTTTTKGALLADRNIDAIALTQNLTEINIHIENEQQLALDGMFTQHGEMFMKVTNHGADHISVAVPFSAYHSAYPSQKLYCIPYCTCPKGSTPGHCRTYGTSPGFSVAVAPGQTSDWHECGTQLDTFNDGTWMFTAKGVNVSVAKFVPSYSVEFGYGASKKSLGTWKNGIKKAGGPSPSIQVAYDANPAATGVGIRNTDYIVEVALAEAKSGPVPPGGKPPALTPIFGYSFCKADGVRAIEPACSLAASVSPDFDKNIAEFLTIFPISLAGNTATDGDMKRKRGYFEIRRYIHKLAELESILGNLTQAEREAILVVSMGDEIGLSVPGGAYGQKAYEQWCSTLHISGCGTFNMTDTRNAQQFWYSNVFSNAYGLSALKPATDLVRKYLPNANIGANYSPLTYTQYGYVTSPYYYPVNKGVTMFRKEAMTMPWGEDYTWQSPMGTQQMTTAILDLFRAGKRNFKTPQQSQTMMYVMAHAPGNTPNSWRRNFFGYIAHGMTFVNLYEFRPCTTSYTENYVDTGYGIYAAVRSAFAELSLFEDITQGGRVTDGDVGFWSSDAFDIWGPSTPPHECNAAANWACGQHMNTFLAGKRTLYIAMIHAELPVDVVVEDDIGATLNSYKYIFLADTHVSQKASTALAAWVKAGGVLTATAHAGMFDEFNKTNTVMQTLLGVSAKSLIEPLDSAIQYIKQDLAFAKPLGFVHWNVSDGCGGIKFVNASAVGARSVFTASKTVNVTAKFEDGTPAVTSNAVGTGKALYFGFMPGLSYFLTAIPQRPTDRGGTEKAFTHFVPTTFDNDMLSLLVSGVADTYERQVNSTNNLVHGRPVVAAGGKGPAVAVPLVNWADRNITNFTVTVRIDAVKGKTMKATMASGATVTPQKGAQWTSYTIDNLSNTADVLILR